MKKCVLSLVLLLAVLPQVVSQNLEEDFNLNIPEQKTLSIYSKITVLDSRADTTNLGIIQKGAFNKKAYIKPKIPIKNQIEDLFHKIIKISASNEKELLLNLRDFKFADIIEDGFETGYSYIRADLYIKKDTLYSKIDSIDAVVQTNAIMGVTAKNIIKGSNKLIDFLTSNIQSPKDGPLYSYNDLVNIVTIEKNRTPLYNAAVYKDGVYATFDNLKLMIPSTTNIRVIKSKKGLIRRVEKILNDDNSFEIDPSEIYCIIDQGKIFKTDLYGFTPVEYRNGDFYFIGQIDTNSSALNAMAAYGFFGVLGVLLSSDTVMLNVEMKIDHLNGGAVVVRKF